MAAITPSYIAKLARAEKHLIELKDAIDAWTDTRPYGVLERLEGKKKRRTRRLTFTSDPANTDIPLIAADVIYNLRSALDHLMSSLVASNQRSSAIFPIFFQGVWEPPVPGENKQRVKERDRWASDTKALKPGALAVLKELQPPDGATNEIERNRLQLLNRLSNRDRHEKLPVVAAGLRNLIVRFVEPDGTPRLAQGIVEDGDMLEDKARIGVPESAVNVEISGVPQIAITVGDQNARVRRYVLLPSILADTKRFIEASVIEPLTPFVRR